MELLAKVILKTAENFYALCTSRKCVGKFGKPLKPQKRVDVQRQVRRRDHREEAHQDLTKARPGTNDTQFFMCTTRTKWLDDKHVVFGQVVDEYDVLKAVENVGSGSHRTSRTVVIPNCD
ncbi:Peptidyl-prolyl cis-trans isomerase CYP18-4 [Striga hermonthica]|uniref:Peptidyl-prolyl cis-trans isomerase CYP18-4 n=1 Tax=Striga hermonthica TaxID=68872 RepID=A0A9N7NNN2_STRHE|nr:Peptidyl-prolyl cis-trans isomerase CYP18-4 [Striga hermonthica]